MTAERITAYIACSQLQQIKTINNGLQAIQQIQVVYSTNNCKNLIEKLSETNKRPQVIFISMKMTCGDALLTTTLLKNICTKTIIIGVDEEATEELLLNFLAEGGNACVCLKRFEEKQNWLNETHVAFDPLSVTLQKIIQHKVMYIDPKFRIIITDLELVNSTHKIIKQKYSWLSQQEILLLQLNVLGIKQESMEHLVNMSVPTIKRKFKYLYKEFGVTNPKELATACISLGIVKLTLYYTPTVRFLV
jgi:DNA-binding NarL/FixJ family response regulator